MSEYDVVLLPTFVQVENWRKRNARQSEGGVFSQVVTTFNAWIADLWELHGDGRALIDSLQRQTAMKAACASDETLSELPGASRLASQCVKAASGVPEFESAVAESLAGSCPGGLSVREAAFLAAVGRYGKLIESAGLIEVGKAASVLAEKSDAVFAQGARVLVAGAVPPDWRMLHFFLACPQIEVVSDAPSEAPMIGKLAGGARLRFGFPSGCYAEPALVCDCIRELLEAGVDGRAGAVDGAPCDCGSAPSVIVTAPDPLALFRHAEETLGAASVHVAVQAQVPFVQTDFGRAFLSLCHVVHDERWSPASLTDVLMSPFSGFTRAQALEADAAMRANRLATSDECLSALRAASDTFSQLEELATSPEADILVGVFEEIVHASCHRSDAWRSQQRSAIAALKSVTKMARQLDLEMPDCMDVLEHAAVTASFEVECGRDGAFVADVLFTTQDVAAQLDAGSCDMLVATGLTHQDYPIAESDDAAATLFSKLGLEPTDTPLARARRTFGALMAVPTRDFVCVRPLNDYDGNSTYPCAVVQELVDAYKADSASDDDVDDDVGLPSCLMPDAAMRGEEDAYANALALAGGASQPCAARVGHSQFGHVDGARCHEVLLDRRSGGGKALVGTIPSASQIERYLECPYKWFVSNRIRVERLDESFGPLERGSFAHAALELFYRRFQEQGRLKVDASTLADARATMRAVLDELDAIQAGLEPGSGRLVAVDQLERRDIDALKEQLVSYLDYEAQLLPTFAPRYFEYAIDAADKVEYAGGTLVGKVDRIDVDEKGNAVIIDYKGSLDAEYEISGKTAARPGKVQTRVYAQAVRRTLGLNVVGALYVSYGKAHALSGAYDPCVLEAAHLPNMRVDRCRCAPASPPDWDDGAPLAELSFADVLDCTERLAGEAIDAMRAGAVEPDPAYPGACGACPATSCPKRGA